MTNLEKRLKVIYKLDLFFLIAGMAEVFLLVFFTHTFFLMVIGLITILLAYKAMKPGNIKWNYYLGIWALIKYNPITLALVAFLLGDFISYSDAAFFLSTLMMIITLVLFLASLVIGIIILVKTSRYVNKLKEADNTDK